MKHIMSLDIGTTSTRAIVFDQKLETVSKAQMPLSIYANETGEVEQDPMEIWKKTLACAKRALHTARISAKQIAGIGLTNQRETIIAWDPANSKPFCRAIVWQDRRTAKRCAALEDERELARHIRATTGLVIDPSFSATKLEWLNQALTQKGAKRIMFGTVDTWILWNLTDKGTYATEPSNASRTMLMDLKKTRWAQDLLDLFGIHERQLPRILPSQGDFGMTPKRLFGAEIPITGILGDQQAALFSHGALRKDMLSVTYGTGIFALKTIGSVPRPATSGILTTVAWQRANHPTEYAYETSALTGGAMLEWLKNTMHLVRDMSEFNELAKNVETTGGVTIVPAFSGLAAPDWDPNARGLIIGLNRGTERAHICRAAIEAIACQTERMAVLLSEQTGSRITSWRASGGLTKSNPLMQSQADISNVRVCREKYAESTAAGAAMIAGLGAGIWKNWRDASKYMSCDATFIPKRLKRGKAFLDQYERAVERAKGWVI